MSRILAHALLGLLVAGACTFDWDAFDPRNAGALKVLDHLGFRETGRAQNTFLLGDEWCHSIYLTLPRR